MPDNVRKATSDRPPGPERRYLLRLYVAGSSPRSQAAVETLRRLCERYLPGDFTLEVIDVYQQAERARREGILVAPTVVRERPLPRRRHAGSITSEPRVIQALGLPSTPQPRTST